MTGSALYDAFVEEKVFPELWQRLIGLLDSAQRMVGPLEIPAAAAEIAPGPKPVPTPEPPRVPAEVGTPEPKKPSRPEPQGPLRFDWATIPAGEFLMGSDKRVDKSAWDDETPQHRVYLPEYRIARVPVTVAQFVAFMAANPGYRTTAEQQGSAWNWTGSEWKWIEGANWAHPRGPGSDVRAKQDHPVTCVSWHDAVAFCKWADVRLPTEAEWEKAARGTDGHKFPWGNQNVAGDLLNFADRSLDVDWADKNINDGHQFTAPVGSYPKGASPFGALDMAGNVWEWVADWYDETYYRSSPAQNPTGPDTGQYRVLRGGSWGNEQGDVRAANRDGFNPEDGVDLIGFRCALSP